MINRVLWGYNIIALFGLLENALLEFYYLNMELFEFCAT